jgi:hypothetical protein
VTRLSPNPLRYWGLDGGFAHDEASLERWVDMDTYMRVYRAAGFNLFRWGPDNCSFGLADRIDPRGNVYSLRFARYADLLFATLRRYGYRIEMVLFGNHPPFPQGDADPAEMAAVERYVRYIVDRYGAEVDYWELMNEATVSDGWYRAIGTYLRRVDPYRHPIGTSSGKPGLTVIDFGSDHWYQTENELDSDLVTWQRLRSEPARAFGKPTLVDEQGNVGQNWDPGSATRMRLRSWTAFFAEATLVFWNSSDEKDYRSPVAANIYLGPQERRYIRILQDYTSGFDPRARVTGATAAGGPGLRGYALRGPRDYGLYLVDGDSHSIGYTGVTVAVDPARSGLASWIDPATGRRLATVAVRAGKQTLPVPAFSTDIALKIRPGR